MFTSASNVKPKMRKKIMKQYKIVLVALLGLILTGCYNKFETPEPELTYTDEIFEALNPGVVHISIANLKAKFGETSDTGTNNAFDKTKYIRFVADKSECNQWEITNRWYDTGNYYIKGKVVSNDEQGNIYKSLYIFDGTGAIELKLTNGLYLDYPCNIETKESMWVYVKVRGLFLGNFRMMLSLGDIPTSSYNSYGTYKYYANSNIVNPIKVKEHVFPGEKCLLSEGTNATDDIYVVDKNNYEDIQGTNTTKFLGRLIRFKGLKVHYAGVQYPNADGGVSEHPMLANGGNSNPYPSWIATSGIQESLPTVPGGAVTVVVNRPWYQLAYSRNNVALYGSLCLTYRDDLANDNVHYTSEKGIYMLRTSGYARFSGKYVPKFGSVGDVLAIYQIYASKSDYKGGADDWATYQLAANRIEDIQFENMEPKTPSPEWSALIKWAEDNFPQYIYPVTPDPAAREVEVATWKAQYLANKPANDGSPLWAEWNAWADWIVWILENTPEDSYLLPQQIVEDTDTIE
jgi:hypothetical protein